VVVGIRSAPGDGGIAPIVHGELQEGSWPDADAGFGGAAFEFARGNCGAGRGRPEVQTRSGRWPT
jgi:hypothetical protein